MNLRSRIYVAGHLGLVGSSIVRRLLADGANNLVLRTRKELDLTQQAEVDDFFASEKPSYVFLAAAKVGGIQANSNYPAEFLRDNLAIQTNVIHSAWKHGTRKLLFLGSSCIYPRDCPQPIKEEYLLTGALESTNEWYAIAKIAGLKMCQAYRQQYGFDAICVMPTNLYGPGDNFDPSNSHVVPGLIQRFVKAQRIKDEQVTIWGTGKPLREFLFVDDLAAALVRLVHDYDGDGIVNVGSGEEVSIAELAHVIADIVGYRGELVFDPRRPDGTPRKLLDSARMRLRGWNPETSLVDGLYKTYKWFVERECVTGHEP